MPRAEDELIAEEAPETVAKKRFRKTIVPWVMAWWAGFIIMSAVLVAASEFFLYGELLSNISGHLGVLALVPIAWYRKNIGISACLMLALPVYSWAWVWQATEERAPLLQKESELELSVMVANTAWWNREDPEHIAEVLSTSDVDVLFAIEVAPILDEALTKHDAWYTSRGPAAEKGPYSVRVYSRYPVTIQQRVLDGPERDYLFTDKDHYTPSGNSPVLICTVKKERKKVRLICLHPPPPMMPKLSEYRLRLLKLLIDEFHENDVPTLCVGDWNTSPASHLWRKLHAEGLRRPAGRHPYTWFENKLPSLFIEHFGISIDYICGGPDIALGNVRAVDIPGSDHRALRVECQVISRDEDKP